MLNLNRCEYREKVLGCFLGKNIGGTLGAPMEWYRQVNNVEFYTQDLNGEPLPNDDLDIQLIWLVALEEMGVKVDSTTLADYWCTYLTPHWEEYGQSKANMRSGLLPPLSGTVNNEDKHSCGAFIRSEIWACIAPGNPDIAVQYAYNDAILDHGGTGEGTYAEMFCAALESAAFIENDIEKLIKIGLSYIPDNSAVKQAVKDVVREFKAGKDYLEIRDYILRVHGGAPRRQPIPAEDIEKGFDKGVVGFDAPGNIAILILGLLWGGDDFEKVVCTTVNCGEDTDCTAATVASIYGIIHGASGIPEKWVEPIGHSIKTACVNLGEMGIEDTLLPKDIHELTERIDKLADLVLMTFPGTCMLSDKKSTKAVNTVKKFNGGKLLVELMSNSSGPVFKTDFFTVGVNYGETGPFIRSGEKKTISLKLKSNYRVQGNMSLHIYAPENLEISPSRDGFVDCMRCLENRQSLEISFLCEKVEGHKIRGVIELACDSRPVTILVPLTFINGDFY
jgi:ADP-ribosylglycohydrolase